MLAPGQAQAQVRVQVQVLALARETGRVAELEGASVSAQAQAPERGPQRRAHRCRRTLS